MPLATCPNETWNLSSRHLTDKILCVQVFQHFIGHFGGGRGTQWNPPRAMQAPVIRECHVIDVNWAQIAATFKLCQLTPCLYYYFFALMCVTLVTVAAAYTFCQLLTISFNFFFFHFRIRNIECTRVLNEFGHNEIELKCDAATIAQQIGTMWMNKYTIILNRKLCDPFRSIHNQ